MKKLTAEKCRALLKDLALNSARGCGLSQAMECYKEALEIALPMLEQQDRGEGWIEWEGSDYQPDITPKLQIKRRDGVTDDGYLNHFEWDHIGDDTDIIAYRIIPEQPTNQNGEQ